MHCTLQHQTMSPSWSWSLLGTILLQAMAEPQDFPIECCNRKTVGSVSYTLVPEPFHGELPHQCKNNCIYTVSGTSSQKFCFKTGSTSFSWPDLDECIPPKKYWEKLPFLLALPQYIYIYVKGKMQLRFMLKKTSRVVKIPLVLYWKYPDRSNRKAKALT